MNILERLQHIQAEVKALSEQCEELPVPYGSYFKGMVMSAELSLQGMQTAIDEFCPPPSTRIYRDTIQDDFLSAAREMIDHG